MKFESLILLIFAVSANCLGQDNENGPKATQQGNLLKINSEYGEKLFMGDIGFADIQDYSFEIPIESLKPKDSGRSGRNNSSGGSGGGGGDRGGMGEPGDVGDSQLLVVEANRLFSKGRFNESLKYVEEILRRNPSHVRGLIMKGSLLHALGQPEMAKESWQKAAKIDPKNEQLQSILRGKL